MAAALIAVLVVALLVNLALGALFLWLSCKVCGVPATYRRALLFVFLYGVCGAAVGFASSFLDRAWADQPFLALAVRLLLQIVLLVALFRLVLSASPARGLLAGLLWMGFSAAYAVAFVFAAQALLVEAFVVPTGGMAETVLGHHKDVTCPSCGLVFPINASMEADPTAGLPPTRVYGCTCPNCRQAIHFSSAPPSWVLGQLDSKEVPDPGLAAGDRILAGKGLFGARRLRPQRLDVVVYDFHHPERRGPAQPVRYVKRLIGLPGETIAIHAGKLYRLPPEAGPKYQDVPAEDAREVGLAAPRFMHPDDPALQKAFADGRFAILRKPPEKVLALRRLVYDNDHPASDLPAAFARWAGDGWESADGNGFRHGGAGGEVRWLRYRHLLRIHGGKPSLVTDVSGYNTWESVTHGGWPGQNWAGDLILECEAALDKLEGELALELGKGVDRFQARFEVAAGTCTLVRLSGGEEQKLASAPAALAGGANRLRFANVDERLTVWVGDRLPFGDGVTYSAPAKQGPDPANDLAPAAVGARGAPVSLRHVKLYRDTYYTACHGGSPARPDADGVTWDDPATWDELRRLPVATYYVQPGHYFVLGDNSPESADSRTSGAVAERDLLGKAVFVYYPWGRAGFLR